MTRLISAAICGRPCKHLAITRYWSTATLADAIEVDVDALGDGEDVQVAGVMEHIEEAGVHSGDSACAIPPHSLEPATVAEISRQIIAMGKRSRSKA